MQHIKSRNNTPFPRSKDKNDNWRKQSYYYLATKKFNHENNLPEFKFNGQAHLKPGGCTVLLTLMLLSSVVAAEASAVTTTPDVVGGNLKNSANPVVSNSLAFSQDSICTASSEINNNVLLILTMAQLVDSKLKIDSATPQKFHLECEKIKDKIQQTVETLPASEARIKRVLEQPEFEIVCSSPERINEITGKTNFVAFDCDDKKIYLTGDIGLRLISHEFIHADYFFRHSNGSDELNDLADSVLPIYPLSKETIKQYQAALDKGDERINDFKRLQQKINNQEKLSQAQLKRFHRYEEAAKDCLKEYLFEGILGDDYDITLSQLSSMGWKPGITGFTVRALEGLDFEIVDIKRTSEGPLAFFQPANSVVAVCITTTKVDTALQGSYRNADEKVKLAERDAYTFEHLSENAIKVFYPEAYEIRTRDLQQ